jgi:hypothetical protein
MLSIFSHGDRGLRFGNDCFLLVAMKYVVIASPDVAATTLDMFCPATLPASTPTSRVCILDNHVAIAIDGTGIEMPLQSPRTVVAHRGNCGPSGRAQSHRRVSPSLYP